MSMKMDPAERTRLLKLADQALNLAKMDMAALARLPPQQAHFMDRTARTAIYYAQKLLILGHILGTDDGKEVTTTGNQLFEQHVVMEEDYKQSFRKSNNDLASHWDRLQEIGPARFGTEYSAVKVRQNAQVEALCEEFGSFYALGLRALDEWLESDVLQIAGLMNGQGGQPRKSCTFCGTKANKEKPEIVLLAYGRCKAVWYCDKVCQSSDWKKGHKAICKAA